MGSARRTLGDIVIDIARPNNVVVVTGEEKVVVLFGRPGPNRSLEEEI